MYYKRQGGFQFRKEKNEEGDERRGRKGKIDNRVHKMRMKYSILY